MSNKQETIADIVKEMHTLGRLDQKSTDKIPRTLQALGLRTYADRIEAAAKREREATREKSSRVGNAAKMREAFVDVYNTLEKLNPYTLHINDISVRREFLSMLCHAKNAIDFALAVPPRNCDRPECATTKAAQDVWRKEDGGKTAYYEWLLQQYEEGGAE